MTFLNSLVVNIPDIQVLTEEEEEVQQVQEEEMINPLDSPISSVSDGSSLMVNPDLVSVNWDVDVISSEKKLAMEHKMFWRSRHRNLEKLN